jgi:hypothetical protein
MKILLEILNFCVLNLFVNDDYSSDICVDLLDGCKSVGDLLCKLLEENFHTENNDLNNLNDYNKFFRFDETCNKFYEIIPKYDTNKKVKLSV